MILQWPSELPRPDRDGYQRTPQDGRRVTQSDIGPKRFRRRLSQVAHNVQMQLLLTRSQRATFDRFFADDCRGGTELFWMPDPTTDSWPLLDDNERPILVADGRPLLMSAQWLCSFGADMPVETVIGTMFRISFSIQVMP